jgi:murein DD-endopeptidase MepM/ murein hydrolase activator NlpD
MAITKDAIDYSDIASPQSANKFQANSVRKAFEYDSYDGKTAFIALVLAMPTAVTAGDASPIVEAPQPTAADDVRKAFGVQSTNNKIGKICFRARILGPNSPHTFIPNPCGGDLVFTQETLGDEFEEKRLKLVSMHTMFYTSEDFSVGSGRGYPNPGDFVEVFLEKGDHGFNLQKGRYEGTLVNKSDVFQTLAGMEIPYALVGAGAAFNFENPVRAYSPVPQGLLNKVGMPYEGSYTITSNWQKPGVKRNDPTGNTNSSYRHGGTDVGCPKGTPIYAVADGVILTAGGEDKTYKETCPDPLCKSKGGSKNCCSGGGGGKVVLKHFDKSYELDPDQTVYSKYFHLSKITKPSGNVKAGEKIGESGGVKGEKGSGNTSGPHLHMEIWVGGVWNTTENVGGRHGVGPGVTNDTDKISRPYSIDFFEWLLEQQRKSGLPGDIAAGKTAAESTRGMDHGDVGNDSVGTVASYGRKN